MTERVAPTLMQNMPIFRGLNETDCRQLADIAAVVSFEPGDMLLKQGERCQNLWVMLEGECEIFRLVDRTDPDSERVPLAVVEPHAHFGEMSFFHPAPHSASVWAKTAVKVMRISHPDYQDLVHDHVPAAYKLAYNCIDGLADRLRRMDEWIATLLAEQPAAVASVPEWSNFRERLFDRWNL